MTTPINTHKHSKVAKLTITTAYSGPVTNIPSKINPAAHNGIRQIDTCRCGAVRHININGDHQERSEWIGGDPDYETTKNPAAVALGRLNRGSVSEKKHLALVENARKPRGSYADRTETEVEFTVEHDYGISDDPDDMGAEIPIVRRLFKLVTVCGRDLGNGRVSKGGRISWSARWYCGERLVRVENSKNKPKFVDCCVSIVDNVSE